MRRITILFLRRLWLPTLAFGAFCLICVAVYTTLERLRAIDAFLLDHSSAFDRVPFCPRCDKAIFDFRIRGSVPFSCASRNG